MSLLDHFEWIEALKKIDTKGLMAKIPLPDFEGMESLSSYKKAKETQSELLPPGGWSDDYGLITSKHLTLETLKKVKGLMVSSPMSKDVLDSKGLNDEFTHLTDALAYAMASDCLPGEQHHGIVVAEDFHHIIKPSGEQLLESNEEAVSFKTVCIHCDKEM